MPCLIAAAGRKLSQVLGSGVTVLAPPQPPRSPRSPTNGTRVGSLSSFMQRFLLVLDILSRKLSLYMSGCTLTCNLQVGLHGSCKQWYALLLHVFVALKS